MHFCLAYENFVCSWSASRLAPVRNAHYATMGVGNNGPDSCQSSITVNRSQIGFSQMSILGYNRNICYRASLYLFVQPRNILIVLLQNNCKGTYVLPWSYFELGLSSLIFFCLQKLKRMVNCSVFFSLLVSYTAKFRMFCVLFFILHLVMYIGL